MLTDDDVEEQNDAGVDEPERDVIADGLCVLVPTTVTDPVIFPTDEVAVGARAVADWTLDGAADFDDVVDCEYARVAAAVCVAVPVAEEDFVLLAVAVALDVFADERVADAVAVTVFFDVVVAVALDDAVEETVADELAVELEDAVEVREGTLLAVFADEADSLRESSALRVDVVDCEATRVVAADRDAVTTADAVVVFENAADIVGVVFGDADLAALRDATFDASALRVCAVERVAVAFPDTDDVARADCDMPPDIRADRDKKGVRVRLRVDVCEGDAFADTELERDAAESRDGRADADGERDACAAAPAALKRPRTKASETAQSRQNKAGRSSLIVSQRCSERARRQVPRRAVPSPVNLGKMNVACEGIAFLSCGASGHGFHTAGV